MSKVIDLSLHNGHVDFVHMREAGVEDVIIRASMGYRGRDFMFPESTKGATLAGLGVGVYHLWDSNISAVAQYRNFKQAVIAGFAEIQYIALDVEEATMRNHETMFAMHRWLINVEDYFGVTPYIYTSHGLWNSWHNGGLVPWASEYPLWVADYDKQPEPDIPSDWDTWALWQYSGNGNLLGHQYGAESWSVDLNRRDEPLDNIIKV